MTRIFSRGSKSPSTPNSPRKATLSVSAHDLHHEQDAKRSIDTLERSSKAEPPPSAQERLAPSSRSLMGLDLAVTAQALSVPALRLYNKRTAPTWETLLVPVVQTNQHQLVDTRSNVRYELLPFFANGAFGRICRAIKHDTLVKQSYVAKELLLTKPPSFMNASEVLIFRAMYLQARNRLEQEIAYLPPREARLRMEQFDARMAAKEADRSEFVDAPRINLSTRDAIKREVNIMLLAESPLAPHAILQTEQSQFLLLPVLQGDGLKLLEHLSKPEERRWAAAAMLLSGAETLEKLHGKGFAHRDIKPENFLFDRDGTVLLSDFGLATEIRRNDSVAGTQSFMPFEALSSRKTRMYPYLPDKADIWGLAMTAMEAVTDSNFVHGIVAYLHENNIVGFQKEMDLYGAHEMYEDAWHNVAKAYDGEKLAIGQLNQSDEEPMEAAFIEVYKNAPQLFEVLLNAMHPNPSLRPTAAEVVTQLRANLTAKPSAMIEQFLRARPIEVKAEATRQEPASAMRHKMAAAFIARNGAAGPGAQRPAAMSFAGRQGEDLLRGPKAYDTLAEILEEE